MLNVDKIVKDTYKEDGVFRTYVSTINGKVFTNENLIDSGFEVVESLCSLENIDFRQVEKSSVKFTIFDEDKTIRNFTNVNMELKQSFYISGVSYQVPLGKFILKKPEYTNDDVIEITGYDYLEKLETFVDTWWNEKVIFPISHRNLLISMFNECGVSYNIPTTYINSDFMINKNIAVGDTTFLEFLGYMQEVSVCFYKPDRNGQFKEVRLKELTNANVNETLDSGIFDISFSEFKTDKIDKLVVRGTESDIGVIIGTGINTYIIEANPLLYGYTDVQIRPTAQKIFDEIKKVEYRPFTSTNIGLPYVECGDILKFITPSGEEASAYILNRTIKYQQMMEDSYESKGTKNRQLIKSVNRVIKILNQKTLEIVANVEKLETTMTDMGTGLQSQITQQAGEINLQAQQLNYRNLLTNSDFKIGVDMNWTVGGSYISPTGWLDYRSNTTLYSYINDNSFPSGRPLNIFKYVGSYNPTYQEFSYTGKSKKFMTSIDIKYFSDYQPEPSIVKCTPYLYYKLKGSNTFKNIRPDLSIVPLIKDILDKVVRIEFRYDLSAETEDIIMLAPRIPGSDDNKVTTSGYKVVVDRMFFTDAFPYPDKNVWNDIGSNNVVSNINISPVGIKIQAEKIDIIGLTTIRSSSGDYTQISGSTISTSKLVNVQSINGTPINFTTNTTTVNWNGNLLHMDFSNGIGVRWWEEGGGDTSVYIQGGYGVKQWLNFKHGLLMSVENG